jgi:triosephosphate isomerase
MSAAWPRRPRLVAGNWKMHYTAAEGAELARELADRARSGRPCEVAVCPPYIALESVGAALQGSGIHLGAQDLHPERKGAFTGEISGPMLAALGCRFVIVGHSERRHGMGEDDATVALKLRAALRDRLTPIVCVGETLQEREQGMTDAVLGRQVRAAFGGLSSDETHRTVVAYEPVWAIGTGRVATTEEASAAHRIIRLELERAVAASTGERVAILYGGSVTPENAAGLFAEEELDGALVGGASLQAAGFWGIVEAAGSAARAGERRL